MQVKDNTTLNKTTTSDVQIGTAGFGSLFTITTQEEAESAVKKALELGFQSFDTAPLYGKGQSETYIGNVVGGLEGPIAQGKAEIWTKVGRVLRPKDSIADIEEWRIDQGSYEAYLANPDLIPVFDYTPEGIRESFSDSLKRLKLQPGQITGIRIHDPETEERFVAAFSSPETIETLKEMKKEGLFKYLGLGMNDASYMLRILRTVPEGTFDHIMAAGCWNLVDQSGLELFQECERQNISVHNAAVFGSSFLVGGNTLRYENPSDKAQQLLFKWNQLANKYNVPLPAVAIKFGFLPKAVTKVCFGVRSPSQVEGNFDLLKVDIPVGLWTDAIEQGLLPDWVPIPSH